MIAKVFSLLALLVISTGAAAPLELPLRAREKADGRLREYTASWDPAKTALIICDMWDTHTCPNAAARVDEMAPRLDAVAKALRARGALIIHCPSGTMKFYDGTPQRRLAQAAPVVESKTPLLRTCPIDLTREASLPIDDSNPCDGGTTWRRGDPVPWTRQNAAIEIAEGDAITDSVEAYYLLRQRGIEHVLMSGVHLNMCVLHRPFAIRQLVRQEMDVVLLRDLTDTMYNPEQRPYVSHFEGTRLMVEHVERYWCPTTTSAAILGGRPFRFKDDNPVIVKEDFSRGMENWWVEGGQKTWVEDGRLHVSADATDVEGGTVATVWCKTPHPGNFVLELDAHVVSSSIAANNINLFFSYSDPSGRPLFESRDSRRTANYKLYHELTGHIVTFVNEREKGRPFVARTRIRRNPGFNLLAETFGGECRQGVTYRLKVTKRGGEIIFAVDGREVLRALDPNPLGGGLLGLRTFRTHLWWDNIRMRAD